MGAATSILAASRDPRIAVLVEDSSYLSASKVLASYMRCVYLVR
jgi:hypothetical protein